MTRQVKVRARSPALIDHGFCHASVLSRSGRVFAKGSQYLVYHPRRRSEESTAKKYAQATDGKIETLVILIQTTRLPSFLTTSSSSRSPSSSTSAAEKATRCTPSTKMDRMDLDVVFRAANLLTSLIMAVGGVGSLLSFGGVKNFIVGVYVLAFGLINGSLELTPQPHDLIRRYAPFLLTFAGKGLFYILVGGLLIGESVRLSPLSRLVGGRWSRHEHMVY